MTTPKGPQLAVLPTAAEDGTRSRVQVLQPAGWPMPTLELLAKSRDGEASAVIAPREFETSRRSLANQTRNSKSRESARTYVRRAVTPATFQPDAMRVRRWD